MSYINEKFYFAINIKSKIDKNTLEIDQGDIITDQLRNVIGSLTELVDTRRRSCLD